VDTVELTAKLLFLALLWAVLASPFLVVAFFVGRAMRRRGVTSPLALLSFSLVLAFLLAPIPTPIITVFYPSGLALIGGAFFAHFLSEETYYQGLRPWVATSLIITLAICAVAVPWLIARRKGRE
jgi:hypothetical protein